VRSHLAQRPGVSHGDLVSRFLNLKLSSRRVILPVALCGAIAAPIASSLLLDGSALLALERGGSVLGLFEARSPGERTATELTKTKRDKSVGSAGLPDDRALGKEFPPDEVSTFASPEQLLALAATPDVVEFPAGDTPVDGGGWGSGFFIPPSLVATGGGNGGGGPGAGGPGAGGPGGGGSGGGAPGGDGPVDGPPPPATVSPPAVPEPATWAMMVLGMGLCGYALRRRTRIRVSGATRSCGVS
jgi:hypothetical protein